MLQKNEKIDINTHLKYEMYGRLATCAILMAAVFVYSWVNRDKEPARDENVKAKIENVSAIKSVATDSVVQRTR